MMHHNYPFPSADIFFWIEESRKKDVSESAIREELQRRGLQNSEIESALAPGATVCYIAENSTEKINFYTPTQIAIFGIILGLPAALYMAHENSVEVRKQDRMTKHVTRLGTAYLVWIAAACAAFLLLALGRYVFGTVPVFLAFLFANILFTLLLRAHVIAHQEPFRKDADKRDECAPADTMIPFGIGLLGALVVYGIIINSLVWIAMLLQ